MKLSLAIALLPVINALFIHRGKPDSTIDDQVKPCRLTDTSASPNLRTVYQFPNGTWVENIAVRRNGKLLVTLITSPEVYLVDPVTGLSTLVHRFPHATSTMGISEISYDRFVVIVGNWSASTFTATTGSWSVWSVDLADPKRSAIDKITDIPEARFLNGMTILTTRKDSVLVGDSGRGVIYRVDTRTAKLTTVIDSPGLKPNGSAVAELGVNGIQSRWENDRHYLYFTNTFAQPLFGRFLIDKGGRAIKEYETVVASPNYPENNGAQADDFTFDRFGNAWITTDPTNTLIKYDEINRGLSVVAGGVNQSVIAGNTAAAFGRAERDRDVLYITTNGGLAFRPPGGVVGGKILALDTSNLARSY